MKRAILISVIVIVTFFFQKQSDAQAYPHYRVIKMLSLMYDSAGKVIDTVQDTHFYYNSLNEDSVSYDSSNTKYGVSRNITTYDQNKRLLQNISQYKARQSSTWTDESREIRTYSGNYSTYYGEAFQNGSWRTLTKGSSYKNQKNLDSFSTSYYYTNGTLVSTYGAKYYYNKSRKIQLQVYWYLNGTKQTDYQKDTFVYNAYGDNISQLSYSLPSDSIIEKYDYSYTSNHTFSSYNYYVWDDSSKTLVLNTRGVQIHNAKDLPIIDSFYMYKSNKIAETYITLTNYDKNDNISDLTYLYSYNGNSINGKQVVYYFYETYQSGIDNGAIPGRLITCYPVPASDRITIQIPVNERSLNIDIYDMSARLVLSQKATATQDQKVELDISSLPHGIYTGTCSSGGASRYTFRMIK
jgi:hypothetical protein